MIVRALLVWLGLLALAVANGGLREALLIPRVGDGVGHALSSLTLSLAVLLLAWLTIDWIGPRSGHEAWLVGGVWLGLVLAFEFLAGHYLFGSPWSRLLEDYDVLHGRIWVLVLITTALAPYLAARGRGLLT